MTKLIPFAQRFIAGTSTRTVSARKLHEFLGSRQDFSTWIKARIRQYDFEQNADYLLTLHKTVEAKNKGAQGKKEYFITLDMAKELAMVERNEKGKQARRYFINCEKALAEQRKLPVVVDHSLQDEAKYQLLNAMVKQMGFKTDPVVMPYVELAGLARQLRGLQSNLDTMQQLSDNTDVFISKMKGVTNRGLLDFG